MLVILALVIIVTGSEAGKVTVTKVVVTASLVSALSTLVKCTPKSDYYRSYSMLNSSFQFYRCLFCFCVVCNFGFVLFARKI